MMKIHYMLIVAAVLCAINILPAEDRITATEASPLDPNAVDIIGEFRRVGQPKYTDTEKRIIDRAQKMQDEHTAIYNKISVGKSVFDYPGLLALSSIHYEEKNQIPYSLLLGIRPHISEFSGSFRQYSIQFDDKGIIQKKFQVIHSANNNPNKP